ncbi:MAG TPA: hypothetical protein VKU00_13165 [Chthonomonadaceae bacterium]|nr:hypothetical protein [Chthonomonadaceae bacterium]
MANRDATAKPGLPTDVIPELRDPWWFHGVFLVFQVLWWIFLPLGRLTLELSCLIKPISAQKPVQQGNPKG